MNTPLRIGGTFHLECFAADGHLKWREDLKNGVANAALNSLLDVYFRGSSPITTWYVGLIDSASYSAIAAADTMSSHGGWIEAVAYNESVRQTWAPPAAASQALANSTPLTFTISGTKTIKGVFLVSSATKSGTAGTLFCTALAAEGDRTVVAADLLKVTYTLSAQSG